MPSALFSRYPPEDQNPPSLNLKGLRFSLWTRYVFRRLILPSRSSPCRVWETQWSTTRFLSGKKAPWWSWKNPPTTRSWRTWDHWGEAFCVGDQAPHYNSVVNDNHAHTMNLIKVCCPQLFVVFEFLSCGYRSGLSESSCTVVIADSSASSNSAQIPSQSPTFF